ncbi:MAG TPA: hypothetical protein VHM25_02205 [Polyangiaceae bacterium]|jgi:hypothetical protein|nr:hypothetical protein [Polyangiaceae bacterium]
MAVTSIQAQHEFDLAKGAPQVEGKGDEKNRAYGLLEGLHYLMWSLNALLSIGAHKQILRTC